MRILNKMLVCVASVCSLTACAKEKTVEDVEAWFNENKSAVQQINKKLFEHTAIDRVDPGTRLKFVAKFGDFDEKDESVYEEIRENCISLGIKNIDVSRVGSTQAGELISIRYLAESRGIVVSSDRRAIGVQYIPDKEFVERLKELGRTVIELDISDWYVVEYESD